MDKINTKTEEDRDAPRARAFLDYLERDLFKYGEAEYSDAEWAIGYLRGIIE